MSHLATWIHSAVAHALGWTLLHFVWEGAVLALLLGASLRLFRPAPARWRYALACLALAAMPVAFAVTLALTMPRQPVPAAMPPVPRPALAMSATVSMAAPVVGFTLAQLLDRMAWLVPFWIAGVAFFYARGMAGWIAVERLRRRGVCAVLPGWQARLDELARRMRLTRPVALLESCLTDSPVLIGYLRPVVLLPLGCLTGLSAGQVECILLHELAHIRRHDYVVNLLESVVEGLLFYHPAVWWVSSVVRAERENCCDDAVVEMVGDARAYAATLAVLEQRRALAPQAALAATGGNLIERIRRLTTEPRRARTSAAPAVSAGIMLVLFAAALAAWPAKKPAQPRPRTALPVAGAALQTSPAAQDRVAAFRAAAADVQDQPVAFRAAAADAQDQAAAFRAAAADAQQTPAAPMTDQERKAREKALRKELATPYRKWLNEDVAYIITDEERAAFPRLQTDQEREQFIENFWLQRDPTPGTVENEFKEEHYRRIAYANEHYASGIPGWKTDRGRVYITYGPPDEIEDHSSGGSDTYPSQQWRYRYIESVGTNVVIGFVDPTRSGEFHMTADPSMVALAATRRPDQFVKTSVSPDGAVVIAVQGRPSTAQPGVIAAGDTLSLGLSRTGGPPNAAAGNRNLTTLTTVRSDGTISVPFAGDVLAAGLTPSQLDAALVPVLSGHPIQQTRGVQILQLVTVRVPLDGSADGFHVFGELTTPSQKIVQTFEAAVNKQPALSRVIPLAPGSYRLTVVVKNQRSGVTRNSALDFTVD